MATKKMTSEFHKFFVDELKDIYWAENALVKELPKMAEAATSPQLKKGIEKHLAETKEHVERLEKVFESVGEKAVAKKCDAMEGILKEGKSILEDTEKDTMTRDAGIILASQKVEHYEIATYGTLRVFAKHLDYKDAEKLLTETLENEKVTDLALTKIAETYVNEEASSE